MKIKYMCHFNGLCLRMQQPEIRFGKTIFCVKNGGINIPIHNMLNLHCITSCHQLNHFLLKEYS
jgi:hypothetical protein